MPEATIAASGPTSGTSAAGIPSPPAVGGPATVATSRLSTANGSVRAGSPKGTFDPGGNALTRTTTLGALETPLRSRSANELQTKSCALPSGLAESPFVPWLGAPSASVAGTNGPAGPARQVLDGHVEPAPGRAAESEPRSRRDPS